MSRDRNKSDLTHRVTEATYIWLDNHGFKPVETEVEVAMSRRTERGWIADLAGVIVPTQTELIEMKMIPRPPRYKCSAKLQDYEKKREEWEALYRPLNRMMTCLVEVKTTRADYLGDDKWARIPPTDLAFVAIPSGMMKPEEWPTGWGVFELREDVIVKVRNPAPRVATVTEHLAVIYQIAVRRDHRSRYEESRELQKAQRAEDAIRTSMDRIDKIVDAVRDIAAGRTRWGGPLESVEHALRHHGIRNAGPRQLEELAEIFGIAAKIEKTTCNSELPALH